MNIPNITLLYAITKNKVKKMLVNYVIRSKSRHLRHDCKKSQCRNGYLTDFPEKMNSLLKHYKIINFPNVM